MTLNLRCHHCSQSISLVCSEVGSDDDLLTLIAKNGFYAQYNPNKHLFVWCSAKCEFKHRVKKRAHLKLSNP